LYFGSQLEEFLVQLRSPLLHSFLLLFQKQISVFVTIIVLRLIPCHHRGSWFVFQNSDQIRLFLNVNDLLEMVCLQVENKISFQIPEKLVLAFVLSDLVSYLLQLGVVFSFAAFVVCPCEALFELS